MPTPLVAFAPSTDEDEAELELLADPARKVETVRCRESKRERETEGTK